MLLLAGMVKRSKVTLRERQMRRAMKERDGTQEEHPIPITTQLLLQSWAAALLLGGTSGREDFRIKPTVIFLVSKELKSLISNIVINN